MEHIEKLLLIGIKKKIFLIASDLEFVKILLRRFEKLKILFNEKTKKNTDIVN